MDRCHIFCFCIDYHVSSFSSVFMFIANLMWLVSSLVCKQRWECWPCCSCTPTCSKESTLVIWIAQLALNLLSKDHRFYPSSTCFVQWSCRLHIQRMLNSRRRVSLDSCIPLSFYIPCSSRRQTNLASLRERASQNNTKEHHLHSARAENCELQRSPVVQSHQQLNRTGSSFIQQHQFDSDHGLPHQDSEEVPSQRQTRNVAR